MRLNTNGQEREKTDYYQLSFGKPELGKQTVRIVPSAFDPSFPFQRT